MPSLLPTPLLRRTCPRRAQLTWDADDDTRKRALTRKVTADELKEDDFKVRWGGRGVRAAVCT